MTRRKFRFTADGQAAYERAIDYLLRHNPSAALRFVGDVDDAIERVCLFPQASLPIPEHPLGPFRQFLVKKYRFFFRMDAEVVLIVGVWHGAQLARLPR